jgi:hypothetical protein
MRQSPTSALFLLLLAPMLIGAKASTAAQRGFALHFRETRLPANTLFSFVRIVISCGHVEAITYIPGDWYVSTLRPPLSSAPEYKEFQFTSEAVEFNAGHGASRMNDLSKFNGAVRISVTDPSCFDLTVLVDDDLGDEGPGLRFQRSQLRLL